MIATAAEKNLSCFRSGHPLADAETELAPLYIALVRWQQLLKTLAQNGGNN